MSKLPPPPFFVFRGQENEITALHFPSETDSVLTRPTLFTGNRNGQIVMYDLKSFRAYHEFTAHQGKMVVWLTYHKSTLLTQGREGMLNIWIYSVDQWSLLRTITSENMGFCASELFQLDSQSKIVSYNDTLQEFEIHNYETGIKTKSLELKSSEGMCMCLKVIKAQDRTLILSGCESGNVLLFDFDKACQVSELKCHDEPILCIDYDKHINRGISGSPEDYLQTWSIANELQIVKDRKIPLTNPGASAVKIRQDGKIVIVAGHDSSIRVFSWKTLKPLAVLSFHKLFVNCLAFSPVPVGKVTGVFASGSKDQNVALWSLY